MLMKASFTDPWLQTLGLLSFLSGDVDPEAVECAALAASNGRKAAQLPVEGKRLAVQVRVVERPTHTTAIVSWRDPTRCSYGDQVWQATRAREAGVCAMSGRPIQQGDTIYKPRCCKPAPLNADAMILQAVIRDAVLV